MATITKLTATIAAGQSLSAAVNTGGNFVVGLIMPAAWTPARVSVQVSTDNVTYNDLYGFYGPASTTAAEFVFNVVPNAIVAIDPDTTLMARYIKLRSGTRDEPVAQQASRSFGIITVNAVSVQLLPAQTETE